MQDLHNKRIVLGMSGGIACYKSADLVRRLVERGAHVDVVMTDAATRFITPVTMQAVSGHPVYTDQWDARIANNMPHIDLSRGADAILVAPASADFLAKLVHGRADDLLSLLCLARACPLLVAPAMKRVLITAGPTIEAIDPVRVITNRSSGKTGYALARAAWEAGAQVTLISGPTALEQPYGVTRTVVDSAQQMHDAVMAHVAEQDLFISVAAVADWRVANASSEKLKKDGKGAPNIEFAPNPDILATVAALPNGPWCVGFAAETENLAQYAEEKRKRKGIAMLVGNLAQHVMDADHTTVSIFDDAGEHRLATSSKQDIARQLIEAIATRMPAVSR